MSILPTITFAKPTTIKKGTVIILAAEGDPIVEEGADIDPSGILARAAETAKFTAKKKSTFNVLAPHGSAAERIIVIGLGNADEMKPSDWLALGGVAKKATGDAAMITVMAHEALAADEASMFAQGFMLRAYTFKKYKKTKKEDDKTDEPKAQKVTVQCAEASAAKKKWVEDEGVARGVMLARDLVNEPANHLGPEEFAARAKALDALGVEIDTLTEKEMKKLGMGALLGVAQGSVRPPRLVVMKWNGGKAKDKPVAFIGKGVVFDTGGISIKPAGGMEDMKGDMGGAAAVTGLMHALAARKARANVIGIIGLVENMPDGNAQRPGDIVTSMSGQTIEVINTDAEGRLVLADALTYCAQEFKPKFMIDLATLTGAILVALAKHYAGLFSNDEELAGHIAAAGEVTGERVWRMPIGPEYDKMIDSTFADMKNIGGRLGGSSTAAQFLQRFVGDTPWAHLDIAGTAMASPSNDINTSWGSGYGVRLLDQMVRDAYEN
ncbi:MAG: leucyl aminopeptidase [Pseudomonadota bacterium]